MAVVERPVAFYGASQRELAFRSNEVTKVSEMEGTRRTQYVEVKGAGPGIFKLEKYSDVQHEVAAYRISNIVGFDFVPASVIRDINGRRGSVIELIEDTKMLGEVEETEEVRNGLYKYWIFGHIIRNVDRADYNLLVKNGRVISIDHEASFVPDPDPHEFDFFRTYYGVEAPGSLVEMFRNFLADQGRQETLRSALASLLKPEDIDITLQRITAIGNLLIEKGKIESSEELRL